MRGNQVQQVRNEATKELAIDNTPVVQRARSRVPATHPAPKDESPIEKHRGKQHGVHCAREGRVRLPICLRDA